MACPGRAGSLLAPVSPVDLAQFLALAASAGVISTVLTAMLNGMGHWWNQSRQARFFALRLAVIFENYSSTCVDALSDHFNAESSGGHIGDYAFMLPEPPALPDANELWPLLDHDATERALSFDIEVRGFNAGVRFEMEVMGETDHDRVVAQLFDTAKEALLLARDLRHRHEVGGIKENTEELERIEHIRRQQIEREQRRLEKRSKKLEPANRPGT